MTDVAGLRIREKLKVPYRTGDLITLDNFVSYCRKNGLRIKKEELEYFDEMGLLIPALYIQHEIAGKYYKIEAFFDSKKEYEWRYVHEEDLGQFNFRNREKKPYFKWNGLSLSENSVTHKDAVTLYKEKGLVDDPSLVSFQPWENFKPKTLDWSHDPDAVRMTTVCYSKYQIYALKFVKENRRITVENEGLFRTPERWKKAGKNIGEHFEKVYSNEFLRSIVRDYNRFFNFFLAAIDAYQTAESEVLKCYEDTLKGYKRVPELYRFSLSKQEKDARSVSNDFAEDEAMGKLIENLNVFLKKYEFTTSDLENWRYKILQSSRLAQFDFPKSYLREISNDTMVQSETACDHVMFMNLILELLGLKKTTVQQLLLDTKVPLCPICTVRPLILNRDSSIRKNAKTCGDEVCEKESKYKLKKKKRATGEYKY